jgi:hypothetical protein
MEWIRREESHLLNKADLRAAFRNQSLDCFQQSDSAKRKRPAYCFFSDLIS